ncbi:MAG: 3-ketoacyl-ACP reductase [Clostridia bacterium]
MIALVTGGSRGIGLEISRRLLQNGYDCIIISRKISDEIEKIISEFVNKATFFPCDVSIAGDRKALIEFAIKKYGKIDLLVNNVGVAPIKRADILDLDEKSYDYVLDINLKGNFFMTQLVAKSMVANNVKGRIINISSISSYTASINRAEYCLSKAGISMATKLYATRLAEFGIGVFEIAPGIIDTDMTSCVKDKYIDMINNGLTLINRMGTPEDIANCVEVLASGKLDFCTGTVLNADGGFSVRKM